VAFVLAVIGFLVGVGVGGSALLLALSGGLDEIYWSLLKHHPGIKNLATFAIFSTILAWGFTFAYLAFVLAG
jgi:hypothetical protein